MTTRCYASDCVLCGTLRERNERSRVKSSLPAEAYGRGRVDSTQMATFASKQLSAAPMAARPGAENRSNPDRRSAADRAKPVAAKAHARTKGKGSGPAVAMSDAQYRALVRDLQTRELGPEDYELLLRLDESVPRTDILSSAAATASTQQRSVEGQEATCAICMSDITEVAAMLCCGHGYHPGCIQQWLTTGRDTCPQCGIQQCANP